MTDFPIAPLNIIPKSDTELAYLGGKPCIPMEARGTQFPIITKEDIFQVATAVNSDDREQLEVSKLTEEYRSYVNAKHALATSSGTSSLHVALVAAGVKPGDEVIVPAFTFIATAMAVLHAKAIPIFADIDLKTFCMDPSQVEELITEKTKAIMPVHVHGLPADMPALRTVAKKYYLMLYTAS